MSFGRIGLGLLSGDVRVAPTLLPPGNGFWFVVGGGCGVGRSFEGEVEEADGIS